MPDVVDVLEDLIAKLENDREVLVHLLFELFDLMLSQGVAGVVKDFL